MTDTPDAPKPETPTAAEAAKAVEEAARKFADAGFTPRGYKEPTSGDDAKETDEQAELRLRSDYVVLLRRLELAERALGVDARARVAMWETGEPADSRNHERMRGRLCDVLADLARIERERVTRGFPPF